VVFWHIIEKRRILEEGRWQTTIRSFNPWIGFRKHI